MTIPPSAVAPVRRPASTLTRLSLILMAASVLVVASVGHYRHIQVESSVALFPSDSSDRTDYSTSDQGLLKARIGFARKIGT